MATNATTLELAAVAAKYPGLSERDLLVCLCYFYCNAAGLTAQQAMTAAAAAVYHKLSDKDLDEAYLSLIS